MVTTTLTLNFVPRTPFRLRKVRETLSTDRSQRVLHARELDDREIRVWEFPTRDANEPEKLELDALWDQSGSGVLPMSWVPPDEVTAIAVRFAMRRWDPVQRNATTWSYSLELEEVVG